MRKRNIWDNETSFCLKIDESTEISGVNRLEEEITIALKQVIGASAGDGLVGQSADCLFSADSLLKQAFQGYKIQDVISDQYAGTLIRIK